MNTRSRNPLLRFVARDLRPLLRPAVSLAAAGLAGLGFLQIRPFGLDLGLTVGAVFLLACGASACNQAQEKDRDALMRRTENRPLPAGRLRPGAALGIALGCAAAGCALLYAVGGMRATVAGLVPLALYNGLYTPLKHRSALSLPVGALAGAAPIPLGAAAAGGGLENPIVPLLFGIAVIWQIPHFWLRAMRHREDYLRAGFVVPFLRLPADLGPRAALLWLPALGASLLLPHLFFRPSNALASLALGLIAVSLSIIPLRVLRRRLDPTRALRAADIAVCLGFLLLSADGGIHHLLQELQ